jgi:hypothetical protein
MSKITLAPNASGTATFTVAAPATNTNRALNLPDVDGTIATTTDVSNTQSTRMSSNGLTDVTSSRATSTVYQNTSGGWKLVTFVCTNNGAAIYVGTTSNPTIVLASTNSANSATMGLIPPGYYYKATGTVMTSWYES